ncbi:hypothetical protein LCGC14_0506980 [marine sediment metagenome]|uniref:Uncharacterized protein n=1 Tax=marine sediment metagenome TaxID=412755 RepID=A0A0F9SKN9_9ZZZZ|nr:hypothetical protein [Methylophaga sp.]
MRPPAACQTETLLNGSSCDLQYCPDCKMIHLILGSITLHLSETHFQEFASDLGKGVFKLKSRKMPSFDLSNDSVVTLHS